MPGGGFLRHTLTALLEPTGAAGAPPGAFHLRPAGVARTPPTRALWSKQFRPMAVAARSIRPGQRVPGLELGQGLTVTSDVVERPHPLLG